MEYFNYNAQALPLCGSIWYFILPTHLFSYFCRYIAANTLMNNYAHIFDLLTRLRQVRCQSCLRYSDHHNYFPSCAHKCQLAQCICLLKSSFSFTSMQTCWRWTNIQTWFLQCEKEPILAVINCCSRGLWFFILCWGREPVITSLFIVEALFPSMECCGPQRVNLWGLPISFYKNWMLRT